jgi:hypothetical protein
MSESLSTVLKLAAAIILIVGLATAGAWAMGMFTTRSAEITAPANEAKNEGVKFKTMPK